MRRHRKGTVRIPAPRPSFNPPPPPLPPPPPPFPGPFPVFPPLKLTPSLPLPDEVIDYLLDQPNFECDPVNRLEGDTPLHTVIRWINSEPEAQRAFGASLV